MGRDRTRAAAIVIALLALSTSAAAAPGGPAPPVGERVPEVRVATSGNESERSETLRITKRAGAAKKVVISLGPNRLPDLARGDRVRITSELQVTTDCNTPGPRCRGSVYHYGPKVRARLYLAPNSHVRGGRRALPISRLQRETCSQKRPHYEHHCVFVFRQAGFAVRDPRRLPCPLQSCHVNLVADVHHRRASGNDRLMIGGQRPTGKIPQDRGRINAIRYRDVVPGDLRPTGTRVPRRRRVAPDFKRRVVISKRLDGLRANEQLAVGAQMRTAIAGLPYAVRTSVRLILAESPRATRQGDYVKSHARNFGEIAENNGSNCTRDDSPCVYRKVGVLTMRRDAVDRGGRPRPLYVNLVTVFGAKQPARNHDRVRLRRTSIRVVRFPPELFG
jgi:hypothetical protein